MFNLEENRIEDCSPRGQQEGICELSDNEKAYIEEVLPTGNSELIAARIDELSDAEPPQALDTNPAIAELLKESPEAIDSTYLEAPNDYEQVEQLSEDMKSIEGVDYDTWKTLSKKERVDVLQKVENAAARIAHRPTCEIVLKRLDEGHYGYYAPGTGEITLNSGYLRDDYTSYRDCLDTVLHEGRHAYQDYNLTGRQVHTSPGDITNWRINEYRIGYQDAQTYGFYRYWMQPVEADARKFAEDVLTKFGNKI